MAFIPCAVLRSSSSASSCSSSTSSFCPNNALSHHVHSQHAHRPVPSMSASSASANTSTNKTSSTEQILHATNLSKSHDGVRFLFRDQNVTVHRGDKILILGPNGSGKTSLLHILAGISTPDTGHLSMRKGTVSSLVSQSLPSSIPPNLNVVSAVLRLASSHASTPSIRAALRHAQALAALSQAEQQRERVQNGETLDSSDGEKIISIDEALGSLASATAEMDACPGAWQVDSRVSNALTTLGLPPDARLSTLSGGQKRRVGIAAAIASKPDILFLDEVTNHLSIDGIQFLESFLSDPSLTVVAISHDRAFINAVCTTSIWELDTGDLRRYSPSYDMFLSEKADRLQNIDKQNESMKKALVKQLEWMRRQPKARSTKNKSRVDDVQQLQNRVEENTRQEQQRQLRIQSLSTPSARLGGDVVTLSDVTIRRGGRLIVEKFSHVFERGERVGLVGTNGMGKSTILKAIAGIQGIEIESGHLHVGETVVFGYFDQEGIDLSAKLSEGSAAARGVDVVEELRVVDYAAELLSQYGDINAIGADSSSSQSSSRDPQQQGRSSRKKNAKESPTAEDNRIANELERLSYSGAVTARARANNKNKNMLARMSPIGLLDHFGFSRERQHGFVRHLSGGERRRMQLIALLLRNPNFLILDEVSNDLDVNTLTMVEEVLEEYSGVLILCSHDRFMLDRLVDHLLVMEGDGQVRLVEGKFSEYLREQQELKGGKKLVKQRLQTATEPETKAKKETKKKKLSYRERKEYEGIEDEIKRYEQEYDQLCEKLSTESEGVGYGQIQEWSDKLAQLERLVEEKTERWMELEELQSA